MEDESREIKEFGKDALNGQKDDRQISFGEQNLVNLIVKIIVNTTIRECYEESNKIS